MGQMPKLTIQNHHAGRRHEGALPPAELRARVTAKANFLRALPETARRLGVPDRAIEIACARCEDAARRVEAMGGGNR
jgi:hypothetical protein